MGTDFDRKRAQKIVDVGTDLLDEALLSVEESEPPEWWDEKYTEIYRQWVDQLTEHAETILANHRFDLENQKSIKFRKCESGGCQQYAEFFDPMGNKLCSDCIQRDVETDEYTWEECEAIPEPNSQQGVEADAGECDECGSWKFVEEMNFCGHCGRDLRTA